MTKAVVKKRTSLTWDSDTEIILAVTEGGHYNESVQEMVQAAMARFSRAVFVTANRPHDSLTALLDAGNIERRGIAFVDCVSGLTGMTPPSTASVQYVDSPTLLEKVAMRADQLLKRAGDDRCLLVDSLSTLAVYNGEGAVSELAHNMITKLRMTKTPAAFLIVETQAESGLVEAVASHVDRMVRF